MKNRTFGELKRLARASLTGNYTTLILALLIAFFVPLLILMPFTIGVSMTLDATAIIYLVAMVIIKTIGQLFFIGLTRIHLLLADKQQITSADIFWPFRNQPDRFILATLLLFSILCIPSIPAILCILYAAETKSSFKYIYIILICILFCVIELYLYCMYSLIYPLYIEHSDMAVMEGFRTSRSMMRNNKKRFFSLQLSFIGWQLLGLCSFGIGLLWIYPYILQTYINFYLDLTRKDSA